jgi:hypothetical protein
MHPEKDTKGIPFQRVDTFRAKAEEYGYKEPDITRDRVQMHGKTTANAVRDILRDLFGQQGMRTLLDEYPNFFLDLEASSTEAYLDGHHQAWNAGLIERSNESQAATGRMIMAMLKPVPETDPKHLYAVRILAAHAGVPIEDVP